MLYHCQLIDFINPTNIEDVEQAIRQISGVRDVSIDFSTGNLTIEVESDDATRSLRSTVSSFGYQLKNPISLNRLTILIPELEDETVQVRVRDFLAKHLQIGRFSIKPGRHTITLYHSPNLCLADILCLLNNHGVEAREYIPQRYLPRYRFQDYLTVVAALFAFAGTVQSEFYPLFREWGLYSFFAAMLLTAPELARKGLGTAVRKREINSDLLVLICALATLSASRWMESAFLFTGYAVILLFQRFAIGRMRYALEQNRSQLPSVAHRSNTPQQSRTVPVNEIETGQHILVRKSEQVPVDGRIVDGKCICQHAFFNDEPTTMTLQKGDRIFAGYRLIQGEVEVRAKLPQKQSVLSSALSLFEKSQQNSVPQLFKLHRYIQIFTYLCAAIALLYWAAYYYTWASNPNPLWLENALAFLIIGGSTSAIISSRIIFNAAAGRIARWGIFLRSADLWWRLASIENVIVDKVGTLTRNLPEVSEVISLDDTPITQVLAYSASLCEQSKHKLHRAIFRHAKEKEADLKRGHHFQNLYNKGLSGIFNGTEYKLITVKTASENGLMTDEVRNRLKVWETETSTALILIKDTRAIGLITITDPVRSNIGILTETLKKACVKKNTLLTTDNPGPTAAFADRYGFDEFQGELDHEDRLRYVDELVSHAPNSALIGTNKILLSGKKALTVSIDNANSSKPVKRGDIAIIGDDANYFAHALNVARYSVRQIRQLGASYFSFKLTIAFFAIMGWTALWQVMFAEVFFVIYLISCSIRPTRLGKVVLPTPTSQYVIKPSSRTRSLMR